MGVQCTAVHEGTNLLNKIKAHSRLLSSLFYNLFSNVVYNFAINHLNKLMIHIKKRDHLAKESLFRFLVLNFGLYW